MWVLAGRGNRVERRKKNVRGGGSGKKRGGDGEEVELKVIGGEGASGSDGGVRERRGSGRE